MKWIVIIWLVLTLLGPMWLYLTGRVNLSADYRTASRQSAHLAPDPKTVKEAVIQVYCARAFSWRGIIASHCWISVKPRDGAFYTVYQVVGWRTYSGLPALSIQQDIPDRNWYDAVPKIIRDIRGMQAELLMPKIDAVARSYPYANTYTLWPGPNSNTFPAYVARKLPELELALPADAVGKDFLGDAIFWARAPSGTGFQLSLRGAAGILRARKEGLEINILGLSYGVRIYPFKILLPGFE